MTENASFESWCVIELFGHQKIAGRVTESTIGGCAFLRVDVPAWGDTPAYTKFFGNGAVYSMTPVSEEIVRSALAYIRPRPVDVYMLPKPQESEKRDMHVCNNCGEEIGGTHIRRDELAFCSDDCFESWDDSVREKANEEEYDEEETDGSGIPF